MPAPTEILRSADEEGNADARQEWLAMIHRAAPDTDWKQVNREEAVKKFKQRQILRNEAQNRDEEEEFAGGLLRGIWEERGSSNIAGNLASVTFMPDDYSIYGVSGGGTLWKGDFFGDNWAPLNEDIRWDTDIIEAVTLSDGTHRILTCLGKSIWYSDDQGVNWDRAEGLNFDSEWGTSLRIRRRGNDLYYQVFTWKPSTDNSVTHFYHSADQGANWTFVAELDHDADFWQASGYTSMWVDADETVAYVLHNGESIHELVGDQLHHLHDIDLPRDVSYDLDGMMRDTSVILYAQSDRGFLHRSTDKGRTWIRRGSPSERAWRTGICVWPDDSDFIVSGAVEADLSENGGDQFRVLNNWWDYYGDIDFLHADMMDIRAFRTQEGLPFALFANHGGLHLSTDKFRFTSNLSKTSLNNGQFYDVITDPRDPNYVYGGTQDQGHQRTTSALEKGQFAMEQVISGDYGHYAWSNDGQSLWILYVNGSVQYYPNPQTGYRESGFTVGGESRPASGWLFPTEETPDPDDNSIYIAGGSVTGRSGSHLITMTAQLNPPYIITATEKDFDFKDQSQSGSATISAIEASEIQDGRLYVGTSEGDFFISDDDGDSWRRSSLTSGPSEHWLYGADIYASRITEDLVWFAGSGYDGPAILESTDGGQTFRAISLLLPRTVIHEIATNPEETMIFAATDIGPYVYIRERSAWFSMEGIAAPVQEYYSVEYVESQDLVRFGTHGRGIWDFQVLNSVSTDDDYATSPHQQTLKIYPNAALVDQFITITADGLSGRLSIYSDQGAVIQQVAFEGSTSVQMSTPGIYYVSLATGTQLITETLVVQ